ncbi:MAG: hypothetical protein MUF08_05175 [Burkholderiaceae bacterium]|jgi:hypothetical protein|nr:hypothetical protein [Burkholderiaceae bacterium]
MRPVRRTRVNGSCSIGWLLEETNVQIGHTTGRSEKTVRTRLTRVYAGLGVWNRAQHSPHRLILDGL